MLKYVKRFHNCWMRAAAAAFILLIANRSIFFLRKLRSPHVCMHTVMNSTETSNKTKFYPQSHFYISAKYDNKTQQLCVTFYTHDNGIWIWIFSLLWCCDVTRQASVIDWKCCHILSNKQIFFWKSYVFLRFHFVSNKADFIISNSFLKSYFSTNFTFEKKKIFMYRQKGGWHFHTHWIDFHQG